MDSPPARTRLPILKLAAAALLAVSGAAASAAAVGLSTASDSASPAAAADTGPTALFAVTPAPACADPLCYSANSDLPGVPSLRASGTHMVMINPDIVDTMRGVSHITADRAEESGADIGNSQWVLTGHVRADMAQGQLRSDTATIRIVDRRIVSITAQGSPTLFQRPAMNPPAPSAGPPAVPAAAGQKPNMANVTVRGHAQSITYDATRDQVQFTGDSWFTDGCNEITSQLVTYNMATQTVQAGATPGSSARVHGTIRNTRPGSACSRSEPP